MKLTIISGRSGSGKTIALHVLEDLGYYCIDNLPIHLLPMTIEQLAQGPHQNLAVSLDARNLPGDLSEFKKILQDFQSQGIQYNIIYLDAEENILLTRFSETRRKHPLTNTDTTLREAMRAELTLLTPIATLANLTLDTSKLSTHQLCQIVRDRSKEEEKTSLNLLIQSFGFKHGIPPDADFVFDVRCLPNPYWEPSLRHYCGLDEPVIEFLSAQKNVQSMIEDIKAFLDNWVPHFEQDNRSYLSIAIGCTGGCHRSVFISEQVTKLASSEGKNVQARHRELQAYK